MNIAIILAGGSGKRFGASIPKQYLKLNNKAVIDYVISATKQSNKIDKIIIVMNKEYCKYLQEIDSSIDIVKNGQERNYSVNNAIEHIKKEYPQCDNVIILDGVAPMINAEIIDNYLNLLDNNDVVVTAKKITGELANYSLDRFNRNDYCIIHSPEAYKFNLLKKYFNKESSYTEIAYQLPKDIKLFFNFDFKYNVKITYDYDLIYCETLKKYLNNENYI